MEQCLSYNKVMISLLNCLTFLNKVKRLRKYDEDTWIDRASGLLKAAITAKLQVVVETGSTVLGEAGHSDFFFGIGMSLNHHGLVKTSRDGR